MLIKICNDFLKVDTLSNSGVDLIHIQSRITFGDSLRKFETLEGFSKSSLHFCGFNYLSLIASKLTIDMSTLRWSKSADVDRDSFVSFHHTGGIPKCQIELKDV